MQNTTLTWRKEPERRAVLPEKRGLWAAAGQARPGPGKWNRQRSRSRGQSLPGRALGVTCGSAELKEELSYHYASDQVETGRSALNLRGI